MIRILKRFCLIGIVFALGLELYAEDAMNLNSDEAVVKALKREPQDNGTMLDLSKKNRIELSAEAKSVDAVLRYLGIDSKNIQFIEGYTVMRWSVRRIRVSEKYELLVQFGLSDSGEDLVKEVSVIPYKERLLRHNLSNQKNWDSVVFGK